MREDLIQRSGWPRIVRRHAWWVLTAALYALFMTATAARYMSDTIDYADSIKFALEGGSHEFWEFGHLLWRPLGYVTYRAASPLFERQTGSDPRTGIVAVLIAWNWLAGLVGALALNRFVSRLGARASCTGVVTLAYISTFGVLSYAHSGSSYIPGLACLLVALALLVGRDTISIGSAIAAGTALACAVGFWALYVLVIPAALAFPLVWFGPERRRVWKVGLTTASFVLVLGVAYSLAMQQLGIRDLGGLRGFDLRLISSVTDVSEIPPGGKDLIIVAAVDNVLHFRVFDGGGNVVVDTDEKRLTKRARQIKDLRERLVGCWPPHELTGTARDRIITAVTSIVGHTRLRSWIRESAHEIVSIRGFSRVAFGIPRSFISMGKDGILFKRFLFKDSYNRVTLSDLIRLSLVKVVFFYGVLIATVAGLLCGKAERRLLVLAIMGGIPVLAFAVSWQGGDVERYMPLYPFVCAAWGLVLGGAGARPVRLIQALVLSLVGVMGVVNLPALSRASAERDRVLLQRRLEQFRPSMGPEDRVYVVVVQDPLFQMKRDPLVSLIPGLRVEVLIPLGYGSGLNWRGGFARRVQGAWSKGGKVWISKRVLSARPKAEWDWVEGDETSVSWSELPAFFGAFELGRDLGDEDGFVFLACTPHNEQLLEQSTANSPGDRSGPRETKPA